MLVHNSKDIKTRKLHFPWMGPYIVERACGNGAYYLASEDGVVMASPIAGNRIKKFIDRVGDAAKQVTAIPAAPRKKGIPELDGEKDETPGPLEVIERPGVVTRGEARRRARAEKVLLAWRQEQVRKGWY